MPAPTTTGANMGYPSTVDAFPVQPWFLCADDPAALPSSAAGSANTAYFVAYTLTTGFFANAIRCRFGSGGNGHFDVGIYDVNGNLIVNLGSTATSSAIVTSTITTTYLAPGQYWFALWIDNATDTITRFNPTTNLDAVQSVSASSHLPSTMSGSANSSFKPVIEVLRSGGWS